MTAHPLHAQPCGLVHVLSREMQLSPQAFPARQTLQQARAGVFAAGTKIVGMLVGRKVRVGAWVITRAIVALICVAVASIVLIAVGVMVLVAASVKVGGIGVNVGSSVTVEAGATSMVMGTVGRKSSIFVGDLLIVESEQPTSSTIRITNR